MKPDHATQSKLIHQELEQVSVKPHLVPQSPEFPLTLLGDRQFELLAQQLLEAEKDGQAYDSASLLPCGSDKARDVVLYAGESPVGVIQCKRYSNTIGHAEVLKELFRFVLFANRNPKLLPKAQGFIYQFWTAKDITDEARLFFKEPTAWLEEHAGELPELFLKARKSAKSLELPLQPPSEGMNMEQVHAAEEQQIIDTVLQFQLSHIGQIQISQLLARQREVRMWFFRSPEDSDLRPVPHQVETLLQNARERQLNSFIRAGNLGDHRYRPPAKATQTFQEFLQSGLKVCVITGSTGYGKTSWVAHMLQSPPENLPVYLLRGDDLIAADAHLPETLGRLLRNNPLGAGISAAEMVPAIWNWLDQSNRIVIVDGLDRVSAEFMPTLHKWLQETMDMFALLPIRLVLTSRSEAWNNEFSLLKTAGYKIASDLGKIDESPDGLHIKLNQLDDDEARAMYQAYGLQVANQPWRPLRSPGLIRLYADLKPEMGEELNRYTLLAAREENMLQELLSKSLGQMAIRRAIEELGKQLAQSADARVTHAAFSQHDTIKVIDELIRRDILIGMNGSYRAESDDFAEYLIGSQLSMQQAIELLEQRADDSILIGAVAMAAARSEANRDIVSIRSLLNTLLDRSRQWRDQWFETAARVVRELMDHAPYKSEIEQLFALWRGSNMWLDLSNLGELINNLRLPVVDRLELLLQLSRLEDADDWRTKYWDDPVPTGRFISPLAHALTRIVKENVSACLPLLLVAAAIDNNTGKVAIGLICEAATIAPMASIHAAWQLHLTRPELIVDRILCFAYPAAVPAFVREALAQDSAVLPNLAETVHDMLDGGAKLGEQDGIALQQVVREMLAMSPTTAVRHRLLVCVLCCVDDVDALAELSANLDRLAVEDIWITIGKAGTQRRTLLATMFVMLRSGAMRYEVFHHIRSNAISVDEWPDIIDGLSSLLDHQPDFGRSCALATEMLLYDAEQIGTAALEMLVPLIDKIISINNATARSPLIYYAGTPEYSVHMAVHVQQFRNRIFDQLVMHEDGQTLNILLWKLIDRGSKFSDWNSQLHTLLQRCGAPALLSAAARHSIVLRRDEVLQDYFEALKYQA